ncbi:MAG TPA: PEGA domain-containing protein [Planctomycetota bacterium]|nr:PEGA domain-containing protein [Planctomycetota bacterium]
MNRRAAALLLLPIVAGGCVERFIYVKSDPPGATVTLDDQELGKTPLEIPYTWYGKRILAVELKGRVPVRETIALNPPWWQYFPLDFITDVLFPFTLTDRAEFAYVLEEPAFSDRELEEVKKRAAELREKAGAPK